MATKQANIVAVAGLGTNFSLGLKIGVLTPLRRYQGKGLPIDYMEFVPYQNLDDTLGAIIGGWKDDSYFLCHSYGVRSVMQMLKRWGTKGPRVPLIISFDPSQWVWPGQNAVPNNAGEVHNFWQRTLFGIGNQKLVRVDGTTDGIVNEEIDAMHTNIDDKAYTQNKSVKMLKTKLNIKE